MEIFHGLVDIEKNRHTVMALGNFDGIHMGHRELINRVLKISQKEHGTAAVFTFDPHPLKVLQPEISPPLILAKEDKIRLLGELGIDLLVILPFSEDISRLTPEEFVQKVLVEKFNLRTVVVGYNYTFGRNGQGNAKMLAELAAGYGVQTEIVPPVSFGGEEVSSTLIRGLLMEGKVAKASKLLGYHPFVVSRVVTGDQRGRQIGFPTANLNLSSDLLVPANGVYAVMIYINGGTYQGVANIGVKPTFCLDQPKNLEVHCFGLNQDIYDAKIKVEFIERIRGEQKFASVSELVSQIKFDCAKAGQIFGQNGGE